MNLAATQTLFIASLGPGCRTPQRTRALQLMRGNGRIPPELALRIYGNNVSGARIKSLAAAYPACFRVLGEHCFNNIAYRFIEHTPSVQPDLNRYGATFGDFLNDWTATREQFSDYRYLGDLARLEWLCHTAYYAENDPPFDFKTLAEAGRDIQQTLCFRPGHSVGLLQSNYPVMAIREANLTDGDASEVQTGELPECLVVSRPAFKPRIERVDTITLQVLTACQEGVALGHILDTDKQRAKMIADTLPRLIQRGWITGVTVDKTCAPGDP